MNAQYIKEAVANFFIRKRQCVHFEVGVNRRGRLRADCLCLSMRGDLHLIEVKSSKRDFLSDLKWEGYLDYCHRFSFAMSAITYKAVKQHIPKGVGVLIVTERVSPKTVNVLTGSVRSAQSTRRRDLDESIASNLIIRMAFRSADRNRLHHRASSFPTLRTASRELLC